MPFEPSYFERFLLRINALPSLLGDVMIAGALKALVLASNLGVFESLEGGPHTVQELATEIRTDFRATRILLDLLVSFGYVRRRDGWYSNTAQSSKWLVRSSKVSLADMIAVWDSKILKFWDLQLEKAVRGGSPSQNIFEWFNKEPNAWKLFNSFEMAIARWLGESIVKKVKLPDGSKSLVDVGGGHAWYSILFCRKHPKLSAMVLDRPEPLEIARQNIAYEGLGNRISVKVWDLTTDPIDGGFDCALLFNLLHNFRAEENRGLLEKVRGALNQSGLVVIWENFPGPGKIVNATFDFFSLTYLVGTGAQTYTPREVSSWLEGAGFGRIRRYRTLPGLLTAARL